MSVQLDKVRKTKLTNMLTQFETWLFNVKLDAQEHDQVTDQIESWLKHLENRNPAPIVQTPYEG